MKIYLFIACSAVALSACGKGSIDVVKNGYIDGARTTTVSNALSNRALCSDVKWSLFKDEKNREVVQYSCSIKGSKDFNRANRDGYVARARKDNDDLLMREQKRLERAQASINDDFPETKAWIQRLDSTESKISEASGSDKYSGIGRTQKSIVLEGVLKKLENYSNSYNEQEMLELYLSNALSDEGFNAGILERKIAYMNRLPQEKRASYKKDEIDTQLKRLHSSLGRVRRNIAEGIAQEAKRADWDLRQASSRNADRLRRIDTERKEVVERLERQRESMRREIANTESDIKRLKEQGGEERFAQEALRKFPIYEGAAEIFQWIVNKEGESSLAYGEIQVGIPGGRMETFLRYNRPFVILKMNAQSRSEKIEDYFDELRGQAVIDMLVR